VEVLSYVLSDIDAIKQFWPVILGLVLLTVVMFPAQGYFGPARVRPRTHRLLRPALARQVMLHGAFADPWVSKTFRTLRALDGVDIDVQAGTFHGLIGPNGRARARS